MKKSYLSILLLFFIFNIGFSQNLNYQKELERSIKIPNTPEAQAFEKYGNTSVSLYSGAPNISIPIYTISGRELNLPISLNYDATGVKVEQLASNSGLNWNLNAGGRINRTINGLVDDYIYVSNNPYYSVYNDDILDNTGNTLRQLIADNLNPPSDFSSRDSAINYFNFLKDVSHNKLDTQPDYFSFNVLGYSDTFVYDLVSGTFVSLDNPRINVEAIFTNGYISKWIVTVENGTKFYFDLAEKTRKEGDDDFGVGGIENGNVIQEYNSSWVITKVESPNKKDIYTFSYTSFEPDKNQPNVLITSVTNQMNDLHPENTSNTTLVSTSYKVSPQVLTQITHNGDVVVSVTLKNRNDFSLATAIDNIEIKKPNSTTLKKYIFNHSYFGNTNSAIEFDMRLKLDSISIKSVNDATISSYVFDYFSPGNVPSRASLSRDYLGFYNGKSNSVLYPRVTVGNTFFSGADRSPDFNKGIVGTLKKITYPTKGYTEFIFEADKTPFNSKDIENSTQDVEYGSLTLTGGVGSNNGCGNCCIDQYGNNPKVGSVLFNISEAGIYQISCTGWVNAEAYLFRRSRIINNSSSINTSGLSYDQVIDQVNCEELVSFSWSRFTDSDGDFKWLEPGKYQILLVKPNGGSISLKVHREETLSSGIVGTSEVERPGIRIKNIKDFDHNNIPVSEKEYQYTTTINGSISSGEFMFEPQFYTFSKYAVYIDSPDPIKGQIAGINELTTMTRVNSWSGGSRPHIAYKKVFEIQKATGNNDSGYIEHKFNVGWYNGVFSTGITPNINLYRKDYAVGKEKETYLYKEGKILIKVDSSLYTNPKYFGNSTIYIKNNPGHTFSYVKIFKSSSGVYNFSYEPARFFGFSSPSISGNAHPVKPLSCDDDCLDDLVYGSLRTRQTYVQGKVGNILSKTSISNNSDEEIRQTTNYTYETSGNYLLRETETQDSKGEIITTKFSYPEDFTEQPYTTMVLENRLTDIIQTENLNGTATLAKQKSTYIDLGLAILPDKIQTSKGTSSLEDRILFERYVNNNLVQVRQVNGSPTAYVWGYNNRYVLAKIENATYSDIENLSSFVSFPTSGGLSTTQSDDLRGLANAQVTTYTYDPLIGVTSITDPRGYTIYYEYDEFNRLKQVKDVEGNILSKNEYHYKNE